MTSQELDQTILSKASRNWQKVAIVIAQVSRDESFSFDDPSSRLNAIADRIRHLVSERKLELQGDISNWSHSEVRRPTSIDNRRSK